MATPLQLTVAAPTLSQIASHYSIPPSILQAVLRQADGGPGNTVAGMSQQSLEALGLDPSMQNDPMAVATAAAASLSQQFNQYGDWQQALSAYLTGNSQDYLSPTSAVGGQVWSILGSASADPTFGMDTFRPANKTLFGRSAAAFTNVLQEVNSAGGVATQQHITDWHETSQMASIGGNPAVTQGLQAAAKNNGQSYTPGQCAWYAARSLGFIPGGLGNAGDWAHNAAQMGMTVSHTPQVGTAVVYGRGGGYSAAYGHVAVVKSVNADGTFTVSEMNYNGPNIVDTRVSTMADVIGFIQPPPGTDMATAAPGLKAQVAATATPPPPNASAQQKVTGLPDAPKPQGPPPSAVQDFAKHLQSVNIDPNDFAQNFPAFAASRRRLMQQNSNPGDYAQAVDALRQEGQPTTAANINAYLNGQPHPTYPDLTVQQFSQAHSQATLHSVSLLGRTPEPSEVARLAASGASWDQTAKFYTSLAADNTGDQAPVQGQKQPPPRGQSPNLTVVSGGQQAPTRMGGPR